MKTDAEKFSWHLGETRWLCILPEDVIGESTVPVYSQAQIRISMPGSCVVIEGIPTDLDDGTVQGVGFRFVLNDTTLETVPSRTYDFAIWLQNTLGWECVSDGFKIKISRTCR